VGAEKDYIATRVSYGLNLGGPSIAVTSACSSSLVAVAQACNALAARQCDAAVAGGASEGLVASSDGHVRPFDAKADGTVFGDAAGAVCLKRQNDAERDGDPIIATIRGWAVTNDGASKPGYAALTV
ncbi:thiolase-like protein, partial [Pavlovales sp. CCMP2436]